MTATTGASARTSLPADAARDAAERLRAANAAFAARHPGEPARRQPVHVVYGGGHLFTADTAPKLGALARRALEQFAPDAGALAAALGLSLPDALAARVYERVVGKLEREPVEDYRIDFEDGYGSRPDAEEDGHAALAGARVADAAAAGTLSPFIGLRIKPMTEELAARGVRTLDVFLTALLDRSGGALPPQFTVTLPKVTVAAQVAYFVEVLAELEARLGLAAGALTFELMVETPQSVIDATGRCPLPGFLDAAAGRLTGAHFGTYDYTAGCNITAAHQRMRHPACDFARNAMQVAFAGTGVWLSDGSTTVLPVAPHRRAPEGAALSAQQERENREAVHRAWKLHFDDIQHSLACGFYQGWDLHPAQLPSRYAALYTFFLSGLDAAGERLRNFVDKMAQATLVGDVFDDAATGQGLLNYFLRAINCGAVTEEEALAMTGLTLDELRGRSFVRIMKARRG